LAASFLRGAIILVAPSLNIAVAVDYALQVDLRDESRVRKGRGDKTGYDYQTVDPRAICLHD
jgi:hypothetical protein